MANFTGQNICSTFNSILNIGASGNLQCCLPSSGQIIVTDSIGNNSAICIGRQSNGITVTGNICTSNNIQATGTITSSSTIQGSAICSTGAINSTGDLSVKGGCMTVTGAGNTCVKGTLNVDCALTVQGTATVTGEIRSCADVVAYYTSDCNLKSNLNKICNTQSIISGLSGYSFDWNDKSDKEGSDLGLMAQDVQEVLPSIVKQRDNGYLAVDYIKLIPVLIEEVKRLNDEVEKLKSIQTF